MPHAAPLFTGKKPHRPLVRLREQRLSPSKRGYNRAWARASAAYLLKNPVCVGVLIGGKRVHAASCKGLSECTDHVERITGPDDPLLMDERNWQALSVACNSMKRKRVDYEKATGKAVHNRRSQPRSHPSCIREQHASCH